MRITVTQIKGKKGEMEMLKIVTLKCRRLCTEDEEKGSHSQGI